MNSQPEPNSQPVGGRHGDPRHDNGQWTSADLLGHHQQFADAVDAALTAPDLSDMMRLVRITTAHSRLGRAVR
jgi:hypothetical protein